jgi:DNA polymerase
MLAYHLDYESRSLADLPKVGAFRYANDPSTMILCAAIAEGDNEPLIWRCDQTPSKEVVSMLRSVSQNPNDTLIYAHNAQFEFAISEALWEKTFHLPKPQLHQWRCTAAMGRRAALPSSLKRLAEALKLIQQKDDKGADLIRKFSIPQKKTGKFIEPEDEPGAFQAFVDYCIQDVRVEKEIHKKLHSFELTGFPLQTFLLDLKINARGFPVNLDALRKADKLVQKESEKLTEEFRALTGINPTQGEKFKEWLAERGSPLANLKAETLEEILEDVEFDENSEVGRALTLKKRIGFASLKKIKTMLACAGPHDNRVRGTLTYHGAGTGRWSASLVQPQNFKRPATYMESLSGLAYDNIIGGCDSEWLAENYGPPLEVVASCIRHFIQDDKPMLSMDYSSIEARLLAWQAGEQWKLDIFNSHGKIYEASACQMFGMQMSEFDEYKKEHGKNHPMRQKSKAGELGCGYMGSEGALIKMGALKQGLKEEDLPEIIRQWREANPAIAKMWRDIDLASKSAIKNPSKVFNFGRGCSFFTAKTAGMNYLFLKLPSGRKIAYPQPELVPVLYWQEEKIQKIEQEQPDGTKKIVTKILKGAHKKIFNPTPKQIDTVRSKCPKAKLGEAITIFSKIKDSQQWGRVSVYAGSFCNNQIQGIAGDFMALGALNAEAAGYQVYLLIHDEILGAYEPEKGQSPEGLEALMTKLPEWAEGMPLAAEGGIVKFYQK